MQEKNCFRAQEALLNLDNVKFIGRTRSEPGEVKLDGDLSPKKEETSAEYNEQHQDQLLASQAPAQVNRTILLRPPPLKVRTLRTFYCCNTDTCIA